jgi:hypothetical protein
MATFSQSPKFSDEWIPYLALVFFGTFFLTEMFMASWATALKYQVRNTVGFVYLVGMLYFISRTDRVLLKEYLMALLLCVVLCVAYFVFL